MLWFLSGLWFLSVSWPACLSSGLLGPLSQPTTIRRSQVTLSRPRGSPSSLKDAPARLGQSGSRADPSPARWRSGTWGRRPKRAEKHVSVLDAMLTSALVGLYEARLGQP